MKLWSFVSTLLASAGVVSAVPLAGLEPRSTDTILFKRGDILDKHGQELAILHGININEMYRHSLIKRTDGNDITVWVHNSFEATVLGDEEVPSAVEERRLRQPNKVPFQKGSSTPCLEKSMRSLTSSTLGAFTGGVREISNWGKTNPGKFILDGIKKHTGLVIAGSNSGANACFMAKLGSGSSPVTFIGASDIASLAQDSTRFERQFGSGNLGWKTAAAGSMRCPAPFTLATKVDWRLTFINMNI